MKMFTKNSAGHPTVSMLSARWLYPCFLMILMCCSMAGMSQVVINSHGTPVNENFNTLASTGTTGSALPTGWLFSESGSNANSTYGVGTGSGNGGDTWSYGAASNADRAFGTLRSGNLVSTIGAVFTNSTGTSIGSLTIAYTGEEWRLGTINRTDKLDFQYSLNATSLTTGTWVDADALDFITPFTTTAGAVVGNNTGNKTALNATITGLNIPNGASFYIRWTDFDATSADDGLSVDDFSITSAAAAVAPTVTTDALALDITTNSATLGGNVTSDGGSVILGRGVTWAATATNNNPEISGTGVTQVSTAGTTGAFTVSATSLPVNTEISFKAYATNDPGTSYGAAGTTFYTLANTPSAPTVGSPTSSSLAVSLNATDGNPSSTLYAIRVDGSANYVQADGSIAAGEVWQSIATWSTITVTGLTASTPYSFDVKAKNGANVETGFGTPAGGTTSGAGAQNQTISFGTLSDKTYGDANFFLTATATSNLTVSFQSLNTNVATISNGNEVTIVGAGTVTIRASQAGDGGVNWNPAPDVDQSFDVNPFTLTVSGAVAQDKPYDGNNNAVITGATLVGVIGMDDVTVSGGGSFDDPNAANNINVTANLSLGGNDAGNYVLTQPTGLSADILQASQTITFNPLPNKTTADAPFALTATASSGLPVSYSSGTPAVADVSGNTVTIFSAGSTVITATQAGNQNYLPATPVPQTQVITQAPSVVTYSFGSVAPGTAAPTAGVPVSNLTLSSISRGNNNGTTVLLSTTSASTTYSGASGSYNVGAAAFTGALNTASSTYFEFTLTPSTAHKVSLTNISFGTRSTSTAPQAYTLRSSLDGYTADLATGTIPNTSTWVLRSNAITATSAYGIPVTFRLFGHNGSGNAALGTANWRVDDIKLDVVVEAAPACEGQPVSGTISGGNTFCGSGSSTLSLTGNTDVNSATGLSIQWFSSTNNVDFSPIGTGNETSWLTGTLTQTTYYYAVVSCSVSGLSATTNTEIVTINPIPNAPTVTVTQPGCVTSTGTITIDAPLGAGLTYSIGGPYQSGLAFSLLTPGSYDVTAQLNGCISGITNIVLNTQPFTPAQPGAIQGISNVCPYIGTPTQLTYSVVAVPGATSYTWVVPPTVTLVSGQGTNSILVTIGAGFIANANKLMKVRASSVCGSSIDREFWLKAQFPTTPSPIVASTLDVCPSIGTNVPITYTINAVAATSYIWSAGPGTTITHPYTGADDTTVTVTFSNAFATSAITVQAVNSCGLSGIRSFTITRNNPGLPGLISGPTNACPHISPAGTPAAYSVAPVANATSYNWTVPAGAIGLTGQGTNTISFIYPTGFTSGTVSVAAVNGCGTSGLRSLFIGTLNPATPGVIDIQNLAVCPDRQYSYTIATTPANAQSLLWTVPSGATILSGQGSNSITVSYPSTAVNGNVTVTAVNNCGNSLTRSASVKLPACPVEPPPPFAGKQLFIEKGTGASSLSVNVYPNPTTSAFNLKVLTADKEPVIVRILDMTGRFIRLVKIMPFQAVNIGADLKSGSYMIEVKQGSAAKTVRVMKF